MKKIILSAVVLLCSLVFALLSCTDGKSNPSQPVAISKDSLIKRGEYLVSAVGCDDCHSPKRMGPQGPEIIGERRFSGHPSDEKLGKADINVFKNGYVLFGMGLTTAVGPWGTSFAANISSDSTGIGLWTEEQFIRAIRKGFAKGIEGNRLLLPPMPWGVYRNFNDHDLKSIFAYLQSTKPVKNVVPQPVPLEKK